MTRSGAKQHEITDATRITDEMTAMAHGTSMLDAVGKVLDLVYQIPDSDRAEFLLRFVDGPVLLVSCDPGYDENDRRTNEHWDVYVADASDTEAGKAIRYLDPGEWL
jgi:hypothetical protein